MRDVFVIVILVLLHEKCHSESVKFKQEAAKVVYWNPKHVKEVNLFTYRLNRQSAYITSANFTNIYLWESNVTAKIECYNSRTKQEIFHLDFKLCDIIKTSWGSEWLKEYSNFPPYCPVLPRKYNFSKIELPPKNFPIPLLAGDFLVRMIFEIEKTKEKLLDLRIILRFKKNISRQ